MSTTDTSGGGESSGPSLPTWVLTITTFGLGGALVRFLQNPVDFILERARPRIVEWILTMWEWVLENVVVAVFEAIELGIVDGIAIPIRDAFTLAGTSVYDALMQIQQGAESGLTDLGIAAPFAVILSWLVIIVIVAVIVQIAWGFIETYLPVDSVTGAINAIRAAFAGDES